MADLRLANPFCMLVAGSSQTGKTRWVADLLRSAGTLYARPPGPVHYFYREWQRLFDGMGGAHFHQCLPTMAALKDVAHRNATVVIDDMVHHITRETAELFTVGASRYGVNVIFITQNLFEKSPHFRTISLNCKYICIRKNPRDPSSIAHFARQVAPSNAKVLVDVYHDVTEAKAYSYIFFDTSQETPERLRVRSNILAEDGLPMLCFRAHTL